MSSTVTSVQLEGLRPDTIQTGETGSGSAWLLIGPLCIWVGHTRTPEELGAEASSLRLIAKHAAAMADTLTARSLQAVL